jgi:hypothetical protein
MDRIVATAIAVTITLIGFALLVESTIAEVSFSSPASELHAGCDTLGGAYIEGYWSD